VTREAAFHFQTFSTEICDFLRSASVDSTAGQNAKHSLCGSQLLTFLKVLGVIKQLQLQANWTSEVPFETDFDQQFMMKNSVIASCTTIGS